MNKKKIISTILACAMLPFGGLISASAQDTKPTYVQLNPADASPFNNGEFQGWGTALCWWANRLGYSEKLTNAAAEAFFSDEGLGLDIARYNLGGGDDPTHNHINRSDSKVPGVYSDYKLSSDGKDVESITYDITKDQNQLNIAKAALKANPDLYFEGFSNSAPYFMTKTGCTSGGGTVNSDGTVTSNGKLNNLNDDMYDDFAKFIADATKLFKDNGIEFKSYSPMNEPDTDYWGYGSPKQEGCHFDPGTSQSKMITETRKALDNAGFTDVLVAGMDETSLKKTANNLGSLTDEAKTALGRVDTHTYSDRGYHAQVKAKALELGKNLWQSEVDKGGNGATLASMIIEDMNGMQPSAWVMWDIVDFHKDSKFVDPTSGNKTEANNSLAYTGSVWGVGMADHDNEELVLTNKYYAYGQFTKYINPGDTIIASSANTLAAYNKNTGDIKIVANNGANSSDVNYVFDLSGFNTVGTNVREIRTDMAGKEKWAEIKDGAVLDGKTLTTTLKANTVTTYLIETGARVTSFEPTSTGLKYSYTPSETLNGYNQYFAVYDKNGLLKAVTVNQPTGELTGDFTDCTFKFMAWDGVTPKATVTNTTSQLGTDYAVITGSDVEIKRGDEVQLALGTNLKGDVTWSVDSDATENGIAEISQTGLLKAKKPGKVTVTVKVGDYTTSKTYDITVYATISGAATVSVGKTSQYTLDTNAEGTPVWSVSDEKVATVSQDGTVTGVSAGTVTITATIGDVKATKDIKVTMYTLSGTASWGNATTAPSDANDYRKAADGNLNTYFDGVQNGYVMYDFGKTVKVNNVKLAARSGNGMPERTKDGKVQASNDGITWTDLYTISTAIPSGQYTTISSTDLADQNAYRYFRYTNDTNMTNIAEFLVDATPSEETAVGAPSVTDIDEMSDDFEDSTNIFNASAGDLSADGNQVYATGLERFGNVFVPVKATAKAELSEAKSLTSKDKFRLTFDMFSGWEQNGKENTFSVKDADGNEVVGFTITGGGYNLNQMRIGGTDVLANSEKPVIQCTSTDVKNGKLRGANGWQTSSQKYANNMGLNKKVEIIIDGTGSASVSFTGGETDVSYTGTISTPISVKSLELTGSYNGARGRVVSYDNFDADVISYSSELAAPTPTPEPTAAPTVPESGELINMNFDNGDLTSTSSYGKATGTPKFVTVDNKKCIQFDGTSGTVVTLTDANGNSLLTGQKNITISFKVKPTTTTTSWWFFASPNSSAQTYKKEQYLGAMTNNGTLTTERYNNSGTRSEAAKGAYNTNEWNDVIISIADGVTDVYVNGTRTNSVNSTVNISDMLGKNSVAYIGKANWGSGEYATGYIDDFVIYNYAYENPLNSLDLGDLTAVTADITLPSQEGVTWSTSDDTVVTKEGKVTRSDDTKTATLTAKMAKDGVEFKRNFEVTVIGNLEVADSFAAYAYNDNNTKNIKYTTDYSIDTSKYTVKTVLKDSEGNEQTSITDNGEFSNVQNGVYTVTFSILSGETVKKTVERKVQVKDEVDTSAYLFVHFVGSEKQATDEQIYFSTSTDGLNWSTLNNGSPFLTNTVSNENGVRDPYILRGEDNDYYIIATDLSIVNGNTKNWSTCQTKGSRNIIVWKSSDLKTWTCNTMEAMPEDYGCVWAPEAIYDSEKGEYMVFWASKVKSDNYAKQRIYYRYTKDFKTFTTEPQIYIERDHSMIDTTIVQDKGVYYRFTKDESSKYVFMEKCATLHGDWKEVATYNHKETGFEGPTIYKRNNSEEWCLMLDNYSKGGYKPFVTSNLKNGVFSNAGDIKFDGTYRHGTVMPITQAEYESLTAE